jgi:hypothetical protein
MGSWVDGHWAWNLRCRRSYFVWELDFLERFLKFLNGSPISAAADSWFWKHGPSGCFSIKSTYLVLRRITFEEVNFSIDEARLLPKVLKTWTPTKVAVISLQLLQDRLSTRQNLCHRGIIENVGDSLCVFFGLSLNRINTSLFVSCSHTSLVWYGIFWWLVLSWYLLVVVLDF